MRYDRDFRERGYQSAFLTTFSFDPVGFDNVTLTDLKNSGCRNVAVLADANMLNQSIVDIGVPKFAGQNYHLAKRRIGACFHSKIVLQLGPSNGRIMIGSANLTTAGMIGNVEIFSKIVTDPENRESSPLFAALLMYFERHTDPNDEAMRRSIDRAKKQSRWLQNLAPKSIVTLEDGSRLGILTDKPEASIAEQFLSEIGEDTINRLIVISPFADVDLKALKTLRAALGDPLTDLVPDLAEQDFTFETASAVIGLRLRSPAALGVSNLRGLHAKAIVAVGSDSDYMLTGSMNASKPGLYGRGEFGGNAEAAIFRTVPPGTAIDQLGEKFSECLASNFPASCFKQRVRGLGNSSPLLSQTIDGGSLELRRSLLRWRPAIELGTAKAILLYDARGLEVASIDANSVHMKWAEIDPTVAASVRTGCVLYDDGALSVLIPVVAIDQIDRSAEPAQSRRTQVLLDQMKAARDIQDIFAMLDRLGVLNHESIIASKKTKYRKAGPKAVKAEDSGEAISPKEFGETIVDVTLEGELQFKAATLEELRRAINRQASVYMSRLHDPDRELAEHDTNVASDEEKDASAGDQGTGTSDDEDGGSKGEKTGSGEPPAPVAIPPRPRPRRTNDGRKQFYIDLLQREKGLRACLDVGDQVDLPLDQSLLFRVIVLTVMATASTGEATDDRPLAPFSKNPIGWIHLLARFLMAHMHTWNRPELLGSDLEDHQIEAIGLLAATSISLAGAMDTYSADPKLVARPFLQAAKSFNAAIDEHLMVDPEKALEFNLIVKENLDSADFIRLQLG